MRSNVFIALLILAVSVGFLTLARAEEPSRDVPPYKRVLTGEDARRVAELGKKLQELAVAGKYADAQEPAREIEKIRTRVQGANHWQTIDARALAQTVTRVAGLTAEEQADFASAGRLGVQARQLDDAGRYTTAEPLYRKSLALFGKVLAEDDPLFVTATNDLVFNLHAQRRYAEAEPFSRKALAICLQALGDDHPHTARGYAMLGSTLQGQRRAAEAEPQYEKAVAIALRVLGEDDPLTLSFCNALAVNLTIQGKHAQAAPVYEKALAVCRGTLGDVHPETASAYERLAQNVGARELFPSAEPRLLLEKALAIYQKAPGDYRLQTAAVYHDLVPVLINLGELSQAEDGCDKGLAIKLRVLGASHPLTANAYQDLAVIRIAQRNYTEGERLLQKALDIYVRAGDGMRAALCYNHLALNLAHQGKYADAEPLLRKSLEFFSRDQGEGSPEAALGYHALAENLHTQGKDAEAETMAAAAARGMEAARLLAGFTGMDRTSFASGRSPSQLLAVLLARNGKPAEAWDRLEAGLARALRDELAARHTWPLTAEERKQHEQLLARIQQLDQQRAALLASKEPSDAARQQAAKLQQEREQTYAELATLATALTKKYDPVEGKGYSRKRIQQLLPEDGALLVWIDLDDYPNAADPAGDRWAGILRPRGEPVWIKLAGSGPKGAWTEADGKMGEQVHGAVSSRPDDAAARWQETAGQLYNQRLAPLASHLAATKELPAVRHLIVLPSDFLGPIPVEALVTAHSDKQPAYTVSYAPSGTLFAWLEEQRRKAQPREARLLAVADPAFATPEKPKDLLAAARGEPFQPLPGTRREAEAVAKLFPAADTLLGTDASEEHLDRLAADGKLKDYRYLHLATHGFANPQQPLLSFLALSQDHLPDPLQQVLAGKPAYTGRLTAEHILREWKLDAELVTLSACQTGLGKYERGEGYLGFAQGLLLAGARSLVLSEWSVDDDATALLMTRFYQDLLGKRPGLDKPLAKAEALREAKDWLRNLTADEVKEQVAALPKERGQPVTKAAPPVAPKPYAHPYYWAGFILVGDPS
jgi:CHAT domain-containing protein